MADEFDNNDSPISDDMSQYLQLFLDETEEQLDDLVESLLALERNPESEEQLNEAFRLIHSIKGASGMMGFEKITFLTHRLENRFEQFRSGFERLDQRTMNLVLKCIDFLRQCNAQLRAGESLGSSADLVEQLDILESEPRSDTASDEVSPTSPPEASASQTQPTAPLDPATQPDTAESGTRRHIQVTFEPNLALAELKAQLIISRLREFGHIDSTTPSSDQLATLDSLAVFELVIDTTSEPQQLRKAADVDGVQSIQLDGSTMPSTDSGTLSQDADAEAPRDEEEGDAPRATEIPSQDAIKEETQAQRADTEVSLTEPTGGGDPEAAKAKVVETMRVDTDRLENLMNLAGQLVINRARFVQLADQLRPALRKTHEISQVRDFGDSVHRAIKQLQALDDSNGEWAAQVRDLETGLELFQQQLHLWDTSRRCIGQVNEAIDQLTRVSDSLQRAVMETRMVPVAPLFNRFKRVIRDLALDRGKQVALQIRGEKTELDKRMIDELGDPLMHLVRNCVDHGIEHPDQRTLSGKPEQGTIALEASHSGNNIHIEIRDDGGGINVEKIRRRLVEKGILPQTAVDESSDAQIADYIWHPGLSTAAEVTDVSGRGVGMDVVNSRIGELNGSVEVQSVPESGTTFTIRLPLTLAIINSLLVRIHNVVFSIPIDDVREIVSVHPTDIVTIRDKRTFDVRGEFIPLVQIDEVFSWRELDNGDSTEPDKCSNGNSEAIDVVILQVGNKAMGLQVAELLGSQDIVIKSLAENLIHIRGLSGASILGDGTVCLMLDVGALLDLILTPRRSKEL